MGHHTIKAHYDFARMAAVPDPTPAHVAAVRAAEKESGAGARADKQPKGPWLTFGAFSVAMFAAPLAAYYLSRDYVFGGNVTHAGGFAALVVNIVLIGYIVICFLDGDDGPSQGTSAVPVVPQESEAKKDK